MVEYKIPNGLNALLTSAVILVHLLQFFLLPLFLLPQSMLWALIIVPLIPFNNMTWFLIHEAIHKNLNSNGAINQFVGRLLSVLFGASYQVLSFGHLMHHHLNREWESEYYTPRAGNEAVTKVSYYFKLLFGVYLAEFIAGLALLLLPRKLALSLARSQLGHDQDLLTRVDNFFYKSERITKLRLDMLLVLGFLALSFVAYGTYWAVLVGLIVLRALSISLMDNVFHYDTPADNSVAGKIVSASRLAAFFILNGNYHGLHHARPKLPWNHLPHEAQKHGLQVSESLAESLWLQFHGPKKAGIAG